MREESKAITTSACKFSGFVFSHRQTFALTKCWSYAKEKEEKRLLPKLHIGEKEKDIVGISQRKERK